MTQDRDDLGTIRDQIVRLNRRSSEKAHPNLRGTENVLRAHAPSILYPLIRAFGDEIPVERDFVFRDDGRGGSVKIKSHSMKIK